MVLAFLPALPFRWLSLPSRLWETPRHLCSAQRVLAVEKGSKSDNQIRRNVANRKSLTPSTHLVEDASANPPAVPPTCLPTYATPSYPSDRAWKQPPRTALQQTQSCSKLVCRKCYDLSKEEGTNAIQGLSWLPTQQIAGGSSISIRHVLVRAACSIQASHYVARSEFGCHARQSTYVSRGPANCPPLGLSAAGDTAEVRLWP